MTAPEQLLNETLHARVDQPTLPSTPMSEVVSTARRIRRRRRVRTGVVAGAVLAVLAAPFVLDATRHDTAPAPADRPSDYWSPTDADPRVLLANVALGDPPAVPWIDGSDYVAADGTRTTLPVDQIGAATPYRGGFLVAKHAEKVALLDSQLREVWRKCAVSQFAVSDDGLRTAYQAVNCPGPMDGTLHVSRTDGTDEWTAYLRQAGRPVGFLGNAVVVSSYSLQPPLLVDPDGTSTRIDALQYVSGVNDRRGLVSGQHVSGGEVRVLGAVVDPRTRSVKWRAAGWELGEFSPDGSMVAAIRFDVGGVGVAVFDAETGERLHEFALPRDFRAERVLWEDDEHLLMATTQVHTQAIVRTTLDGAIQRATAIAPYDDFHETRYGIAPNLLP